MPAGDVFGLDGIFLNKSNPITVSVVDINPASSSAGIAITGGSFSSGTVTLNLSNSAGLSTTPFYTGAIIGVSSISQAGIAHTGYNGTFVVTGFAGTTTVSYATTGYVGSVAASIGATTIGYVQLLTDGNVTNTTWSTAQTHGWFGGGVNSVGAIVSTVDRIDFSNDLATTSPRGPLSSSRYKLAATGNSNYGWFGSGLIPTPAVVSTVNRVDFSNDSTTASPRGSLSLERYGLSATGNSNYGWFGGGLAPSVPGYVSTVDRIDFFNDSATALARGPLSSTRYRLVATGNSNYGWFAGGAVPIIGPPGPPEPVSTVDRIDFSNDSTVASVRGRLSLARFNFAATGNSNYGWFGGGFDLSTQVSTVDRIDFSNDVTTAIVRGPLSLVRMALAATGNSNYGWFSGGYAPSTYRSIINRIDFSNDSSTVSVRGSLSLANGNSAATSGQARSSSTRLQKAGNYGWFGGGSPGPLSRVDRIDFSNDSSTATARGSLSFARYDLGAVGNFNYGWFGGGFYTDMVDRIDFSNDSATASRRGVLSLARYFLAATGNSNYGWFGAGYIPSGPLATVDRIDFSNDFSTASPRGPLSLQRYSLAATGNSNYGWFGGGYNPSAPVIKSTVDRIDFSNDSSTATARGPLFTARIYLAATGNSNYGWFGGGIIPGPATTATVDRIDFSNDSVTASPRGPLFTARDFLAATGNSNYGWFGGGSPGPLSRVDRIDFSNGSTTASPRGQLSAARYRLAATSNTPT